MTQLKKSKIFEKLQLICSFLLFGFFVIFVMSGAKVLFGNTKNDKIVLIKQEDIDKEFNRKLVEVANTLNKTLPKFIDEQTRLDRVTAENYTLVYDFTLLPPEITASNFKLIENEFVNSVKPTLIKDRCTDSRLIITRKWNMKSAYQYFDRDGNLLTRITIDPDKDC